MSLNTCVVTPGSIRFAYNVINWNFSSVFQSSLHKTFMNFGILPDFLGHPVAFTFFMKIVRFSMKIWMLCLFPQKCLNWWYFFCCWSFCMIALIFLLLIRLLQMTGCWQWHCCNLKYLNCSKTVENNRLAVADENWHLTKAIAISIVKIAVKIDMFGLKPKMTENTVRTLKITITHAESSSWQNWRIVSVCQKLDLNFWHLKVWALKNKCLNSKRNSYHKITLDFLSFRYSFLFFDFCLFSEFSIFAYLLNFCVSWWYTEQNKSSNATFQNNIENSQVRSEVWK